ncbi:MAG: 1,4-dihydroxy-2-naphthoate polyprenyltransferase [Chloroflexota bacterium]
MPPNEAYPSPFSKVHAWLTGIRVASLSASIVPVLVGTAAARPLHLQRPLAFLAALLASVLIQIGTNFTNDVFDFRSGADTQERLGPARLILSGSISPREAGMGAAVAFGLAGLLGLYLILVGGWPILILGVASILSGIMYTGGPWPMGYHGLGDLFTFTFFGPVAVIGSCYLQTLSLSPIAILASLPVGFMVTAILVVNNLRDIETDRAAGKRTLAVRLDRQATRAQYALLVYGAYLLPIALSLAGRGPSTLLPLLTLPLAVRVQQAVSRENGQALNHLLRATGQLNLLFGLLLAVGLWI